MEIKDWTFLVCIRSLFKPIRSWLVDNICPLFISTNLFNIRNKVGLFGFTIMDVGYDNKFVTMFVWREYTDVRAIMTGGPGNSSLSLCITSRRTAWITPWLVVVRGGGVVLKMCSWWFYSFVLTTLRQIPPGWKNIGMIIIIIVLIYRGRE